MQVWDFSGLRKKSYHWFFYDGTFLSENKKNANFQFFSDYGIFGFWRKKIPSKKNQWYDLFLGAKYHETVIFLRLLKTKFLTSQNNF
tara:strand:- start:170 stop:430 length:261 start_codon:yes stop_codon:yes gene_type:complete